MSQDHTEWTELLSDHLDGSLPAAESRRVEEHLERCEACAAVFRELAEVVARAKALEDRLPEKDLWPSIREAVLREGAPREVPSVFSDRWTEDGSRAPRRVTLTLRQLAAAATVVVALSGAAAWTLRPLASGADPRLATRPDVEAPGVVPVSSASGPRPDLPHDEEVARLERALERDRDRLSPHTVRILEKNLALIDGAIRESMEALEIDPGNPFLEEHLRRAHERRVEYLRNAVSLLDAAE